MSSLQDVKRPDVVGEFKHKGEVVKTEWYRVDDKSDIPDYPWELAHLIGDLGGLTPLVLHKSGKFGLVGGHIGVGEDFEQALRRELEEVL
ncbi:MAG: hypothetical protein KIG14_03420 [Candidatus Sacchiramonaceae bacterium]|nr:hypothetical protein [Candidatus Saccharimonadaceae bacterium]